LCSPPYNPGGGEIFRTRPDRPWGPPSLLCNGYRVKLPGRGVDHPPSSSAEVKERVELYLCSPFGPSWPVLGRTLPFTHTCHIPSPHYLPSFDHLNNTESSKIMDTVSRRNDFFGIWDRDIWE
jgi:hypothetical protein